MFAKISSEPPEVEFSEFQLVNGGKYLPQRSTNGSAGYDLFAAETVRNVRPRDIALIRTGVACKFSSQFVLLVFNRSSNPIKRGLVMVNGVGVIDSDYFGNQDNGGEIMCEFYNIDPLGVTIHGGERIAQCILVPRFNIVGAKAKDDERVGGFGSTGVRK